MQAYTHYVGRKNVWEGCLYEHVSINIIIIYTLFIYVTFSNPNVCFFRTDIVPPSDLRTKMQ